MYVAQYGGQDWVYALQELGTWLVLARNRQSDVVWVATYWTFERTCIFRYINFFGVFRRFPVFCCFSIVLKYNWKTTFSPIFISFLLIGFCKTKGMQNIRPWDTSHHCETKSSWLYASLWTTLFPVSLIRFWVYTAVVRRTLIIRLVGFFHRWSSKVSTPLCELRNDRRTLACFVDNHFIFVLCSTRISNSSIQLPLQFLRSFSSRPSFQDTCIWNKKNQ